jgi:alanyl-tRNA synthetase
MQANQIRQTFLDFFLSKNHHIVPSAPMVIKNDPTLMFTNAGMNQFKDLFLGNREASWPRVADTQKCLRVSGKHNDLEEVGHDTYHHTMFEMLGNWSFGDYFKKEAIEWGWELLTEVFGMDPERLYVTVFEGDEREGLSRDTEALSHWQRIIPGEHILLGSKKDNFWEMGDTGPCGPCSEIHIDLRPEEERKAVPGQALVNTGNPLVIEIWNLVFIEFNRKADGTLNALPEKHVDTGMGFERLCMALQGKQSNYDTDVFQPILQALASKAGIAYGADDKSDVAMRVVADHLRAISFAIADGQLPSNVKAGYVIRRILRRAVRFGYVFLGFREPFIHDLVPVLTDQMGGTFPELIAQQTLIRNVIREEEASFLRTLETGIQKFQNYITAAGTGRKVIDGAFAFELYDTYGFPIDLTVLMAREQGWDVDLEGFHSGLGEQKARSRQAAATDTSDWTVLSEEEELPVFLGYDTLVSDSRITRYRRVTGKDGEFYHLVLDQTPFYAESGGQVGDRGWLVSGEERVAVENTVKEHDLIIHFTRSLPKDPSQPVKAVVDAEKRLATANNHSATHLLHAALRKVLGTHVEQKGSLVDEHHLRFDFTHFAKMTKEELEQVEHIVNRKIRENITTGEDRHMPLEEARALGAMALFGEKYGDTVRVITFDPAFSVELCGGTHVPATGQIGLFRIVSESAIAAGIRRIEAITGDRAEAYWNSREELLEEVSGILKHPKDLIRSLRALVEENQSLRKEAAELAKLKAASASQDLLDAAEVVNGIRFIAARTSLEPAAVKDLAYNLKASGEDIVLVLAGEADGKAMLTVAISDALVNTRNLHAGNMIRELAREIGGGGGGQPNYATAGGKNLSGIPAALARARALLE